MHLLPSVMSIPRSLLVTNLRPLRRCMRTRGAAGRCLLSTSPFAEAPADPERPPLPKLPFRFETGVALFAKRTPRPFPRPFTSAPSMSFSEPLSTFDRSRDRRPLVNGELIRGQTNGDDAVYESDYFIGANDGVGAWSTRPRGHAGLWSRLIMHFWVAAMEEDMLRHRAPGEEYYPDPATYLDQAYKRTLEATAKPVDCHGTTTVCGAQLHFKKAPSGGDNVPLLCVTNLGDSQVMVFRPPDREILFKTTEQWHWFDCPRQLGTNSPDTPLKNAVVDTLEIKTGDVVLAMSDGVIDNLWDHEIVRVVADSLVKFETDQDPVMTNMGRMEFAAAELMKAAKVIAQDPFAESPYMEHAIDEGLASSGGKMDDISVVAALCVANEEWQGPTK